MEVDDPISDKFQTLVGALMAKTTSEIVKVFADVLFETRVEISRSWRKIDELKQELERRGEQREVSVLKNKMTQVTFKREVIEVQEIPLCENLPIADSVPCTVESACTESQNEVQKPEDSTNTRKDSATAPGQVISMITTAASSDSASALNQNLKATQSRVKNKKTQAHVVDPQKSSTSTSIIQKKKLEEKETQVTKKTNLQKHLSPTKDTTTLHILRGRQCHSNRTRLSCTTDQCSDQQIEPNRTTLAVVPHVSVCIDCKTIFQDYTELEGHICSIVCDRCGQSFSSLQALNSHSQGDPTGSTTGFPYRCYLCSQMFATLCGWNMHKRIHTHGCLPEPTQESMLSSPHSIAMPKEINTKVRVLLERIPHAQLEAALSYRSSLSISHKNITGSSVAETTEPTGSTPAVEVVNSAPQFNEGSGIESGAKNFIAGQGSSLGAGSNHSDDVTEDSVIPSRSVQIQPIEKMTPSKSLTLRRDCEESLSSSNDETAMGLNPRKRKLADCNHDVYNGVFLVEKILKWRNKKGQDEVRIKWMPCSLCGAKWKNTWEPAESFVSYKDGKKDGAKSKDKKK